MLTISHSRIYPGLLDKLLIKEDYKILQTLQICPVHTVRFLLNIPILFLQHQRNLRDFLKYENPIMSEMWSDLYDIYTDDDMSQEPYNAACFTCQLKGFIVQILTLYPLKSL